MCVTHLSKKLVAEKSISNFIFALTLTTLDFFYLINVLRGALISIQDFYFKNTRSRELSQLKIKSINVKKK